MTSNNPSTFIISISGPTSSGKTTLARLLHQIFHNLTIHTHPSHSPQTPSLTITCTILHQDDFYLPESQVPLYPVRDLAKSEDDPDAYLPQADWDCPEAIDFRALKRVLLRFRSRECDADKSHARILKDEGVDAKEQTNSVGPELERVRGLVVERCREMVRGVLAARLRNEVPRIHLLFIEGFLLYHPEPEPEPANTTPDSLPTLTSLFDLKILLHTTLALALERRKKRQDYVTLEGWFEDPPGYLENVVWPHYLQYHQHLFVDGDVERGELKEDFVEGGQRAIRKQPEDGMGMDQVVEWGCGVILDMLGQPKLKE